MIADRHGSRPWQIGARSSFFEAVSPAMVISGSVPVRCLRGISYLRLDIRYPICWEREFIKRHLGFFQKP